jgi:hypothetical protein
MLKPPYFDFTFCETTWQGDYSYIDGHVFSDQ